MRVIYRVVEDVVGNYIVGNYVSGNYILENTYRAMLSLSPDQAVVERRLNAKSRISVWQHCAQENALDVLLENGHSFAQTYDRLHGGDVVVPELDHRAVDRRVRREKRVGEADPEAFHVPKSGVVNDAEKCGHDVSQIVLAFV